jgi:hypothetical protein
MAYAIIETLKKQTAYVYDEKRIYKLVKNNKLKILNLYFYENINFYKQLFDALKTNRSVIKLYIEHNYKHNGKNTMDEYYELLSDFLQHETYLQHLILHSNNITTYRSKLLAKALVNNTTLNQIHFQYTYLDEDSCKYFINSLKVNKTIKRVVITVTRGFIDGKMIAELLDVNKSITEIVLITPKIKEHFVMEKALQNNPYIMYFYMSDTIDIQDSVRSYYERNRYNLKLKSLMIEDL